MTIVDQSCLQASHSESEQALQRRLDEVTGELRTERSNSGSLQATLEKSQQDGDALAGEKGTHLAFQHTLWNF